MLPLFDLLAPFQPISISEMSAVKLMNRIDTKFMIPEAQLPAILSHLADRYFVQETNHKRFAHYQTLYYDTPDCKMYLAHHNRKLNRQKLRARIYHETTDTFCEIKTKNNKGRTKKKRIPIALQSFDNMLQIVDIQQFITQYLHYPITLLAPTLENSFDRITMVNYEKTERLTIDLNIQFYNRLNGVRAQIPELVIIELKQSSHNASFFKQLLLSLRIPPKRISKYCLGTLLTRTDIKRNRFNKKLRYLQKNIINQKDTLCQV